MPRYHSADAAGVDLHACIEGPLAVEPQAPAVLVSTGIAMHIGDRGLAAVIVPRSGLGHRGLVTGNLVGVIDADYLGPIFVSLWNRNAAGSAPIVVSPGDRIAQLLFLPVVRAEFQLVAEFSRTTQRAQSGFGSTGESHGPSKLSGDE